MPAIELPANDATVTVVFGGQPINLTLGENTIAAQQAAQQAADSAVDAAASVVDAQEVAGALAAETYRINIVENSASMILGGDYSSVAGVHGASATSAAANHNAIARMIECPTDIADGQVIDGIRCEMTVPVGAAFIRGSLYRRSNSVVGINAVPISGDDTLITSEFVAAAGFAAGGFVIPLQREIAVDGFNYIQIVEAFAADQITRVAFGYYWRQSVAAAQRFIGFVRVGAAGFTNATAARPLSLSLVARDFENVAIDIAEKTGALNQAQAAAFHNAVSVNEAGLKADCAILPLGAGLSFRIGGDSMAEQVQAGVGFRSSDVVTQLLTGETTVVNTGVGGQRLDQIDATLSARAASEWAWPNFVNGSTNDIAQLATYTQIKSRADAIIAKFTSANWAFSTAVTSTGGSGHEMSPQQRMLFRDLRVTHGAHIWDWDYIASTYEDVDLYIDGNAGDVADNDVVTADGLHPNKYGASKIGYVQTRLFRAMLGGAPFMHDEVLPLRAGDAATVVYSNGLVLGSILNAQIVAGDNSDNAVEVNAKTGAIGRGLGKVTQGSRELIIRADNESGFHLSRKTMLICRNIGDTSTNTPVRLIGNARSNLILPVPSGGGFPIANPTKLSMFVDMRIDTVMAGDFDPSQSLSSVGVNGLRSLLKYGSDNTNINSVTLPLAADPYKRHAVFVSWDTVNGFYRWSVGGQSGSAVIRATSDPIRFTLLTQLFSSTGSLMRGVSLYRYMMFTGHAFDWTDTAKTALFFDQTAGVGVNTGGPIVDGQTALIDLSGREGDWSLGLNAGSMGNLLPPTYRGMGNMGFVDG